MLDLSWPQWMLVLLVALGSIYRWSTATYGHFKKRGMPFMKPVPFFGSFADLMLQRRPIHDMVRDIYNSHRDRKYFGVFQFRAPLVVVRDPELIKRIAVKDFEHFSNHLDTFFKDDVEPLMSNSLFMMRDQRWRDMRTTLSPAFTGSKMRLMFRLISECAQEATQVLLSAAELKAATQSNDGGDKEYVPEMKEIFLRSMTDVIASTAFGIQINSFKDPDNEFFSMGKKSIQFSTMTLVRGMFMNKFPKFSKLLGLRFLDVGQSEFFRSLVQDAMRHRTVHGIVRPDMIQLLMDAKRGSLKVEVDEPVLESTDGFATVQEETDTSGEANPRRVWTDEEYTSQCFTFFLAGFESSATLLCVAAHELMEYRDAQMKLVDEIDGVREQLGDEPLTYEILQRMTYMDMVVTETLRKWPPVVFVDRKCTKTFDMVDVEEGESVRIEKGEGVLFPIFGLHRDPQYYPNPDVFDPERFSPANRGSIVPFTYIPFGAGPRNCIASRFVLMETKAFLFYLLSSFTFEMHSTSHVPLVLRQKGLGMVAEKGYNIHLKPRHFR